MSSTGAQRLIDSLVAEGVFTYPSDEPRLIGSRCTNCGNHMFPVQSGCPRCAGTETETVEGATLTALGWG